MPQLTSSDRTNIAYEQTGDGPAVVLIHVGPFTQALNAGLAGLLAGQFTVYTYDRRGRGGSGGTVTDGPDREFDDLRAVIDNAGMRQAPFWAGMEAEAHGLVADYALVGDLTFPPAEQLRAIKVPALVLDGGTASPLAPAAVQVAHSIPGARQQSLDGQPHNVDDAVMAAALTKFFS